MLHHVARIVELSVPLMEHPSESFLAQLEEDMMKLILKHGMMVGEAKFRRALGHNADKIGLWPEVFA